MKKQIISKKVSNSSTQCDFDTSDEGTDEEYPQENYLLPKIQQTSPKFKRLIRIEKMLYNLPQEPRYAQINKSPKQQFQTAERLNQSIRVTSPDEQMKQRCKRYTCQTEQGHYQTVDFSGPKQKVSIVVDIGRQSNLNMLSPQNQTTTNQMQETMGSFFDASEKAENYRKKLEADSERIQKSNSTQQQFKAIRTRYREQSCSSALNTQSELRQPTTVSFVHFDFNDKENFLKQDRRVTLASPLALQSPVHNYSPSKSALMSPSLVVRSAQQTKLPSVRVSNSVIKNIKKYNALIKNPLQCTQMKTRPEIIIN